MSVMHEGVQWVLKSHPRPLADDVGLDQAIEVVFIRDLDATQHVAYLVSLKNLVDLSEHPVEVSLQGRLIKVKPTFDLQPDSHYQLTINGGEDGLMDVRGQRMPVSYTQEFHTKAGRNLSTPTITSPAADSFADKGFEVAWTPVNGAHYYEVEISKSRSFDPIIWPQFGQKQFESKVKPTLFVKGTYYVRVRAVKGQEFSGYSDTVLFVVEKNLLDKEEPVEEGNWTSLVDEVLDREETSSAKVGLKQATPGFGAIEVSTGTTEIRVRLNGKIAGITAKDIRVIKERNG